MPSTNWQCNYARNQGVNKPPSTRIKIGRGANSFTFGDPKPIPPLPEPEDYEVQCETSWKTKKTLIKRPKDGFVINFVTPCPTEGEYIDLIITDKKGNWFSVGEIRV